MKSGDLALFKGLGFVSRVICMASSWFAKGQVFSHIGMVFNSEDVSREFRKDYNLVRGTWYLTESTSISKCYDVFGRKVSGVQIVKLKDKLEMYNGLVWHRGIDHGCYKSMSKANFVQFEKNIRKFYNYNKTTPYEKKRSHLIMSVMDWTNIELAEDLTSLFCSEWVAYHHTSFGWLKGRLNEFVPTDWGNGIKMQMGRGFTKIQKMGAALL